MFANSVQVMLGAIFVSNFFREGGTTIRTGSLVVLTVCFVCAFLFEPETKGE